MKIKTKKQLNLPQLIEWAWDNPDLSHGMIFISNGYERVQINFRYTPRGVLNLDILNGTNISNDIHFTLEEFEEITEDTVLPKVLNIFKNTTNRIRNDEESHIRRNVSVKEIKENSKDYIENDRLYIMNDDYTMTLIWRDGKMVE